MKRNEQLLQVIADRPDAPEPRQVYADWWQEQNEPRGEFVATSIQLASRPNPAKRKQLLAKKAALERAHLSSWTADLTKAGASSLRFERGFVVELMIPEDNLAALPAMMALEPITNLIISLPRGTELAKAMQAECFDRIEHLRVSGALDAWAAALSQPKVARLFALTCAGGGLSGDGLRALLGQDFKALRRLSLSGSEIGDDGLAAFDDCELAVDTLFLSRCGVTDEGVAAFLASDFSMGLRHLSLAANELTDDALELLFEGEHDGLQRLELSENELSDDLLVRFADPEVLPGLKRLDLLRVDASRATKKKLSDRFGDSVKWG
ncbi:MAG: TIGR02996 domain-containing protein [Archangium sp.]|nr:TIGR02996 domain-containing protein [Archangium sp.]